MNSIEQKMKKDMKSMILKINKLTLPSYQVDGTT
jgi:hypothetical protein